MKCDTGSSLGENNTEDIPNKDLMNVHVFFFMNIQNAGRWHGLYRVSTRCAWP